MFAVPGWSVAADGPKAETLAAQNPAGKSKKRKRPGPPVTPENLENMWDKVIEGKKPEVKKGKGEEGGSKRKKKRKEEGDDGGRTGEEAKEGARQDQKVAEKSENDAGEPARKKDKKEKKKDKKNNEKNPQHPDANSESKPSKPAQPLPAPAKLTPLQAAMRAKLIPARFRHLNETLYTRPSEEAFKLFEESPEMFDEYHAGFRQQVEVWPENPVDGYIEAVRTRGAVGAPIENPKDKKHGKGRKEPQAGPSSVAPLPRTKGICTIADLGCGDARLATVLNPETDKLRLKILSYDLQSPNPLVTRADIASLPLPDASVNVAIFCLALMGTNWLSFIEEAHRILHWKGELWVAEIKSRFGRRRQGPVAHSVGNRKKGAKGAKEAPDFSQDLAVEVDGQEDKRNETDVGAFVNALRKRGFVLRGEGTSAVSESVDLSNKMFVKMYFVKAATPSVGKGAEDKGGKKGYGKKPRIDEVNEEVDEGSILKPCVYKLR
ncbi:hypothetical protein VUR80DRAFT_2813 [Thermomyces stellatus]